MKFALFLAICASLVYYGTSAAANPQLETLGSGEYCIYSTEYKDTPLATKIIDTGFSFMYFCDSPNAAALRTQFDKIDGESISLTGASAGAVLKKLGYSCVSRSDIDSAMIIYAFSPRAKTFVRNGSQKINLQIAQRGGILTVGWPVILGAY